MNSGTEVTFLEQEQESIIETPITSDLNHILTSDGGTSLLSYASCSTYSLVSANDSLVLYFVAGNLFVRFAFLHFITDLFIAFNADSPCPEVFKMSTVIVL